MEANYIELPAEICQMVVEFTSDAESLVQLSCVNKVFNSCVSAHIEKLKSSDLSICLKKAALKLKRHEALVQAISQGHLHAKTVILNLDQDKNPSDVYAEIHFGNGKFYINTYGSTRRIFGLDPNGPTPQFFELLNLPPSFKGPHVQSKMKGWDHTFDQFFFFSNEAIFIQNSTLKHYMYYGSDHLLKEQGTVAHVFSHSPENIAFTEVDYELSDWRLSNSMTVFHTLINDQTTHEWPNLNTRRDIMDNGRVNLTLQRKHFNIASVTQFGNRGAFLNKNDQIVIFDLTPFQWISTMSVSEGKEIVLLNENTLLLNKTSIINIKETAHGVLFKMSILARKVYRNVVTNGRHAYFLSHNANKTHLDLCVLDLASLSLTITPTEFKHESKVLLSENRLVVRGLIADKCSYKIFNFKGEPVLYLNSLNSKKKTKPREYFQGSEGFNSIHDGVFFFLRRKKNSRRLIAVDLDNGQKIMSYKINKKSRLAIADQQLLEVYPSDESQTTLTVKLTSLSGK